MKYLLVVKFFYPYIMLYLPFVQYILVNHVVQVIQMHPFVLSFLAILGILVDQEVPKDERQHL